MFKGLNGISWKCSQLFLGSHLPWKFHENPFSRFFRNDANRQTDKQTNPGNGQRWNFNHNHNLRHGASNYCSGSLEPESSCHDRDWIMELPMEADILTFTGILTPEDASVASCFPFDITISLSRFPLLSIPPLHSAIPQGTGNFQVSGPSL